MHNIIENGINSIRIGLEDFEQGSENPARLTSAVRNVYAGILILAKGKLYELSPPDSQGIFIRVVQPRIINGRLESVPKGRKTIDFDELKNRFQDSGLSLDWQKVERIRSIRNDLEHFYHGGPAAGVREALADAATVVRSLLDLLGLDPVGDLGTPWWDILLRNKELFDEELAACRATFAEVDWVNETARSAGEHLWCLECESPLIRQQDAGNREQAAMELGCGACGTISEVKGMLETAVRKQYSAELYLAHSQGGEIPVVHCPQCRREAIVVGAFDCAACGHVLGPDTHWCELCQNPLSEEEHRTGSHVCPADFPD